MVAPNSPIALAKHRIAPAITPGRQSGRVMVANTQERIGAQRARPPHSSRVSTASIDRRMARTSSGKPITAQASAAPVQRKEKTMPNCSSRKAPIGPRLPNEISSR